jgi:hypothetical protein
MPVTTSRTQFLLTATLLLTGLSTSVIAQAPRLSLAAPRDSLAHEFTRVASVRELSDGRVLVIDSRERALFVADLAAGTVRQLGRTGRGPLEYERPSRLIALGTDSTLLMDPANRRWLLLVGAQLVATLSPSDSVVERAGTAVVGADERGNVISTALIDREVVDGDRHRDRLAVQRVHRATARADTLLVVRGAESRVETETVNGGTRRSVIELALSVPEQVLVFPDGWLAVARQRPYRVEWLSPSGERVVGPELAWANPPVSAAEIELYRRRMELQLGRSIPAPLTGMPFVDVVAPFPVGALRALPSGRLLVTRSEWSRSQGTEYDIVDRRGRLTAQVRLPSQSRIVGVGEQHIYTVSVDDDGIERLRRHRAAW